MGQRDEAISQIRRIIFGGALPVGQRTSERLFTEKYLNKSGLGRTPVREALAVLAQQGLIDQIPQVGFEVRRVDADEAVKTLLLELGVESVIVREVAQNQAGQLGLLSEHTEALHEAAKNGDTPTVMARSREFHVALARIGGFSYAVDSLGAFRDRLQLYFLGTQPFHTSELMKVADLSHHLVAAIGSDSTGLEAVGALGRLLEAERLLVTEAARANVGERLRLPSSRRVGAKIEIAGVNRDAREATVARMQAAAGHVANRRQLR